MNKLSSTKIYGEIMTVMPSIKQKINVASLEKYVIDQSYYDWIFKPIQSKKYPLIRPTLKYAKEGRIKLFNMSDPKDMNDKSILLPDYFSCFAFKSLDNKETVSYVNSSKKIGYYRNKTTKEINGLTRIDENSIYAFLQTGATSIILSENDEEITNNIKMVSLCAELYSTLYGSCIAVDYPISGDRDYYIILNFILACCFLQIQAEYPVDRAISIALKLKNVEQSVILSDCKSVRDSKLEMKNINDLIMVLENEFNFIRKGSISPRSIVSKSMTKYGSASFMSLEHFQSFLNMIQNAHLLSNMYNDKSIRNDSPIRLVQDINQILLSISGE